MYFSTASLRLAPYVDIQMNNFQIQDYKTTYQLRGILRVIYTVLLIMQ